MYWLVRLVAACDITICTWILNMRSIVFDSFVAFRHISPIKGSFDMKHCTMKTIQFSVRKKCLTKSKYISLFTITPVADDGHPSCQVLAEFKLWQPRLCYFLLCVRSNPQMGANNAHVRWYISESCMFSRMLWLCPFLEDYRQSFQIAKLDSVVSGMIIWHWSHSRWGDGDDGSDTVYWHCCYTPAIYDEILCYGVWL